MDAPSPETPTNQPKQEPLIRKIVAVIGLVALLAVPVFLLVVLQRSVNSRLLSKGDIISTAALVGVAPGEELLASTKGRPSAILFFSVDCPHCQREIPIFNEMVRRFGSKVEFVAVAFNDRQKATMFARTSTIPTKMIVDEKGVVGRIFGVSELPMFFLISHDQRIEWIGVGEQPKAELMRRLSELTQGAENNRK